MKRMTLLQNHLKIAFRNMWKFRVQTVVCVLGLSVGMACFALGTLWLRYIESFENFVPEVEDIYLATMGKSEFRAGYEYLTHYGVGRTLKEKQPQVMDYCTFDLSGLANGLDVTLPDGEEILIKDAAYVDASFFKMFGVKVLEGQTEQFGMYDVVLTRSVSRSLFGKEKALGKQVQLIEHSDDALTDEPREKRLYTVSAVVEDCPENTQFRYSALLCFDENQGHERSQCYNFVKLNSKAECDSLIGQPIELEVIRKLIYDGNEYIIADIPTILLFPLETLRADYPGSDVEITTGYIRWFMILGILVILCSLCNYIITMVNHLRRRSWEMSLRRVLGSSRLKILLMVSTETVIVFLLAALFGWLETLGVLPYFREYSGIELSLSSITLKLCGYLILVIICGILLSALTAWVVMRKTQQNILGARQLKHSSTLLDRVGVILQLALSMGIIFCVSVMLRQVNYLMTTEDVGFSHTNIGIVDWVSEEVKEKVRQSAFVEESLEDRRLIFPKTMKNSAYVFTDSNVVNVRYEEWDKMNHVVAEIFPGDSVMADFYHFELLKGRWPHPDVYRSLAIVVEEEYYDSPDLFSMEIVTQKRYIYPMEVCVNEALCKELGWTAESAIGKSLYTPKKGREYRVCGVMKDWLVLGATIPAQPAIFQNKDDNEVSSSTDSGFDYTNIVFRTKPGRLQQMCDSVEAWLDVAEPVRSGLSGYLWNMEKEYNKYVASEQMLIKILLAVALCSLFVCVLGAFSLVSLSLTERRKEIAIRKAHGAHISDILQLFLKTHYWSLGIAALIAYPLSFIIMRNWLENYTRQVGVEWWVVPVSFLAISLVVIATISLKIYFAAKEKAARALAG